MAEPNKLNVLILEDNQSDVELILHQLRRDGFNMAWERVETEADFQARLAQGPDIILSDYSMPQFDAPRALQLLFNMESDIPFIVISGTISEEVAVQCVKQGAADYLLKDRLGRLGSAIAQALEQRKLQQAKRRSDLALRELAHQNAILAEIGQIISSSANVDEVYAIFAEKTRDLIPYDRVSINLVDYDSNEFVIAYSNGPALPDRTAGTRYPLAGNLTEYVVRQQRGILFQPPAIEDVLRQFPSLASRYQAGYRSYLTVPLVVRDAIIGSLHFRSRQPNRYTEDHLKTAQSIAYQIAGAIANAQLYSQQRATESALRHSEDAYRQLAEDNRCIAEIGRIINSSLDINEVYQRFSQEMRRLVPFNRLIINTVDEARQVFVPRYANTPFYTARQLGVPAPLPGTMTERILQTRQPVVRHDLRESGEQYVADAQRIAAGVRSVITLPLVSQGRIVGTLGLQHHEPNVYGSREQAILERVATQIAPALVNAQLYEQALAEKELAATTLAHLHAVVNSVDSGIMLTDHQGQVLWANQQVAVLLGMPELANPAGSATVSLAEAWDKVAPLLAEPAKIFERTLAILPDHDFAGDVDEFEVITPERRVVRRFTAPVQASNGESEGRLWVFHDVTEQRHLEQQFLQAQKMESVGRLAGGVAHDFNNLLTAITGYCQIAAVSLPKAHPVLADLEEVQKAAQRATNLTRQLLAFSRRQPYQPRVVDLNDLVQNTTKMLRRLIGENINLLSYPAADLPAVRVDPGQMEQVLTNLAVNSRDAMPNGGNLIIETGVTWLDEAYAHQRPEVTPGRYVRLTVSDTGTGMTPEVKARLFEPFFTTKEVGKGTGLGLATCYGIVKQSNGHIQVYSELGRGTAFKIYLPPVAEPTMEQSAPQLREALPRGHETVLVAEDEPLVRSIVTRVLRDHGYRVLEAGNGDEALRILETHQGDPIRLLITDVVMPQMGGEELVRHLRTLDSAVKIIFTSGYSEIMINQEKLIAEGMAFLQKPFALEAMLSKVRDMLDGK